MKNLIDKNYVDVSLDEEKGIIKVTWKSSCSSEEYHETYENILKYSKNKLYDNFFVDIRKQKIISPIDRKWFEAYVLPEAVKLGLKRAAVLME